MSLTNEHFYSRLSDHFFGIFINRRIFFSYFSNVKVIFIFQCKVKVEVVDNWYCHFVIFVIVGSKISFN